MKRKLNEDGVPTPVEIKAASAKSNVPSSFEAFGLDSRLLQAIAKVKFGKPTPVQAQAIPLALDGKDIVARARTGTGKTAAYVLPIVNSILQQKISRPKDKAVRALLLVPTKELAQQVAKIVGDFCAFCAKDVRALNLTQKVSEAVQRSLLAEFPDIVVATPARAWANVTLGALNLDKLTHMVIDEADLVLSYDHGEDLRNIAKSMPNGVQSYLMSATLSEDVDGLKTDFCRDPAILALDDDEKEENKLKQRVVICGEEDKFLFLYVLVKLKLLSGKTIIFVEDIDRSYRVKLYLEQFGVRSCVLNSELPVNSRIHVVDEFNKGVYDIIIASDEHEVTESGARFRPKDVEDPNIQDGEDADEPAPLRKKQRTAKKDKEYGISRGIDFKNVACVLNFDLPPSSKSYTHRIGRTARAGKSGTAMSFSVPRALYRKNKHVSTPSAAYDEEVLSSIRKHQAKKGAEVEDYPFDMTKVEGFRYRTTDALRAVTRIAIREARTKELRNELIKSEKLKKHFEENPEELHHLRHDAETHAVRIQPHLKHVPDYLMPNGGGKAMGGEIGFVGMGKTSENKIRRNRRINAAKGRGRMSKTKRSDPLKTFNARGRGKS